MALIPAFYFPDHTRCIALLEINKGVRCYHGSITTCPFCVLANVVSQYHPGYHRGPVAPTDAICLFKAADAHCMERGLNSKRLSLCRESAL